MFSALSLPDLDALDPAALKAMLIEQHESYTATLKSRTSEIERLALLAEKLQRMLFGKKSEKVLRRSNSLSCSLKNWRPPTLSKSRRLSLRQSGP